MSDVQTGNPKDLQPGSYGEVLWRLAAKRRTKGDTTLVCITASFDNHKDVKCCAKIYIPPTEPILECDIDVPTIVADNANMKYVPMPFPVTVTVRNTGGMKTDSVFAELILTPDLAISPLNAPVRKRVAPAILLPGGQGSAQWQVSHPITLVEKGYVIKVRVTTANAEETICEKTVIIPPLDAPILAPRCIVPDSLHFDEAADSYVPNPFTVTLRCVNNGRTPAQDVTGTIILPSDVVFDPPGQPVTKAYIPTTMLKWQIGDPIPELSWTVRWTKRYRYNSSAPFRFTVVGRGVTGVLVDSVETRCEVPVPGLQPSFVCSIAMPDSLGLNATETDVTPNPFTVSYTVTNTSKQSGKLSRVYIDFPLTDGLSLDPSSPMPLMNQAVNVTLDKGEDTTFTWVIKVANRITRRNVRIAVTAIDDEGNPIECYKQLPIANLKTSLVCQVSTSEGVLRYYPVLQEYDPTSFVISSVLTNTGGANLNDIVAELRWSDPSGLDLIEYDATFPDNTNPKTRGVMFPSTSETFQWGFRLKNKNLTLSSQYIEFDIVYKSKETPEIQGACTVLVEVEPVVAPKLICSLGGPDTIKFVTDQYIPTPFNVDVHIENIGTGEARNMKTYILQDTRFTVIPPSYHDLGNLSSGGTLDLTGTNGFALSVNPRETSGYDTVWVVVVADGVSTTCALPIWVERELRPRFDMVCTTNAVLRFDDGLNDYVPNPFPVQTTVTNVGDTRATDCKLVFVGPPRIMPFDQVTTISIGDLEPGQSYTFDWQMIPLRRDVGGTETMKFEVHGYGGLGPRLQLGECAVDIYVPPAKAPVYTCTATAQTIRFDAGTGRYIPDPFQVTSVVTNTGLAEGMGITAEILLPPGLVLSTGELATKPVANLPSGAVAPAVIWNVRPIARPDDATVTVTIKYTDRFGNATTCTVDVLIPKAPEPGLELTCMSDLYVLEVDQARGEYKQGSFQVRATVKNTSGRPVNNVEVTVLPMDRDLQVDLQSATNPQLVAVRLDPNMTAPEAVWTLVARLRTVSGPIPVMFLVTGVDDQGNPVPTRQCEVQIFVPAVGRPRLTCDMATSVETPSGETQPRLRYDEAAGDYAGTQSTYGDYTVFTVTAHVNNDLGEALARSVRATLLPPEGVTLEMNESAIKYVTPSDIAVQNRGQVSWTLRPQQWPTEETRRFQVLVTSENADPQQCELVMVIDAAPKVVSVDLPDDALGSAGQKVTVPVLIGETIGRDVYTYKLNVRFDPSAVRFVDATSQGTLTERGWNGVKATVLTETGASQPNAVRVEDFTTGSKLSTSQTGALVFLRFEVVHNPVKIDEVVRTPLSFVPELMTSDGRKLVQSMNSNDDGAPGDVSLITSDGQIAVSGNCVLPLVAGTSLAQNTPNPFNPSTQIEFRLGAESDYTLRLYDAVGRDLGVIEQGHKPAGTYTVRFEAKDLPSGVYLYRLSTPTFNDTKRMIIAR